MAANRWLGRAGAVAQVDTVTIALTWATNDTVTLTINGKDLVVTIGTLITTAQVATTIQEAWEDADFTDTTATKIPADGGQDFPEHAEITATVSGSVVTLTHDTAGTPFTLDTIPDGTAGDGSATRATATTATGPNHYDNVDNWSLGAIPAVAADETGDDVYFDNSDVSVLHGLDQSHASNHVPSITVARNYTGQWGLPKQNAGGYVEYRGDYLQLSATTVTIGRGDGSGSGRLKLDTGVQQTAITIESMGSSVEFGTEAFLWKGTHVSNTLEVHEGSVGVAIFGGEVATILTLLSGSGTVRCAKGTTLTTVTNESGAVSVYSNVTGTLLSSAGTVLVGNAAVITTLTVEPNATIDYRAGNITTLNLSGTIDFSNDNTSREIATFNFNRGGNIIDPLRTAKATGGGSLVMTRGSDVETVSAS